MEFSERMKIARKRAGLTQKEAAQRAGMQSDSAYRFYESGSREAGFFLMARIAKALNVSLDWLAGLSNSMEIHDRIPLESTDDKAE